MDAKEVEAMVALIQRRLLCPIPKGGPDSAIDFTHYHVLSFLSVRGRATVAELRDALGIAQSSTSQLIDRLVWLGLVDRASSVRDRRATLVVPTAKGLRRLRYHQGCVEINLTELGSLAGGDTVDELYEALARLAALTAPLSEPLRGELVERSRQRALKGLMND